MAISADPREFRNALGAFCTGVTVITTCGPRGEPVGNTASSFNSVSLDPPLILWSLGRKAYSLKAYLSTDHFAVNVLRQGQEAVAARHRTRPKPLDLVFHGGSGSSLADIHETLDYGVVKMNVDTDMQYAFTRAIADHMFTSYAGVLKIDGGVGQKKAYDPRSYMKKAIGGMKERVVLLVHVLRNSLIPVVTVIALGIPTIFGGAIITEQIFRVNGLGQLLITGIQGADLPLVQTLTFIFALLIVLFNLIADVLYGILDPRIRYD